MIFARSFSSSHLLHESIVSLNLKFEIRFQFVIVRSSIILGLHMLAFLVEVLEKGMQQVQVPVLNIIHCMLHYIDLSSPHAQPISSDLIRVIAKYLDVSVQCDPLLRYWLFMSFLLEFLFTFRILTGKMR